MTDKEIVNTYFDTLSLYSLTNANEETMNLSLLQRPKRIKQNTKTLYIYAPSIISSEAGPEPGTVVRILDVYPAQRYEETTVRIITEAAYQLHRTNQYCIRYDKIEDTSCVCTKPTEEMDTDTRSAVFYVLLSDLGK